MTCSQCGKPVDEHMEGRRTDRCVWEKKGGNINELWRDYVPFFSSPDSIDPAWGLVEGMFNETSLFELGGSMDGNKERKEYDFSYGGNRGSEDNCIYAPTPQLAIIRAYLAKEEKDADEK